MAVNGGKLCWDGTARSGGINSTAASAWWPLRICTGSSAASNRTNVTVLRPIRREREGGGTSVRRERKATDYCNTHWLAAMPDDKMLAPSTWMFVCCKSSISNVVLNRRASASARSPWKSLPSSPAMLFRDTSSAVDVCANAGRGGEGEGKSAVRRTSEAHTHTDTQTHRHTDTYSVVLDAAADDNHVFDAQPQVAQVNPLHVVVFVHVFHVVDAVKRHHHGVVLLEGE